MATREVEALRESEARFRDLVETTSDMVWEIDPEGVYTYVSPRVRELLGYEPEELVGQRTVVDLLPPDDRPRFEALFRAVRDQRRPVRFLENVNLRKDGRPVFLETSAVPFFDAQGRLVGYRGVDRDISERKAAEAERERLLEENRRQRQLLETILAADPAGLAVVAGPELVFRLANPAYRSFASRPGVDLAGHPLAEILPPETFGEAEDIRQVLATGEPVDVERRDFRLPDGSVLSLSYHLRRVPWQQEPAVLIAMWNVTPLERARQEARRRAAELDATIAAIADGLIIYGREGQIVRMNQAASRILGLPEEELARPKGEQWALLHAEAPDGRPLALEESAGWRALQGETVEGSVLVVHPQPGRTIWLSASAAPIVSRGQELRGAVVSFRDTTAEHELEEQRRDLLRAVSHDLRNPLAGIMGHAELLARRLQKAELEQELGGARAILAGARRMNVMIQDLVDSARSEAGELKLMPEVIELPAFVEQLKRQQAEVLETARVVVEPAAGLPPALADPDRLERILVNLLSNALKYSPPASEVTVSFTSDEGFVITSVRDRGRGIAPEDQPRLFQRYYRTEAGRERREGLGLGLYITRVLVEAHGGRIWVESQPGAGSTFSFSLPSAA